MKKIFCWLLFWTFPAFLLSQNYQLDQRLEGHEAAISYLAMSAPDQLLVSGDEKGNIIVRETATGGIIHRLEQHKDRITDIAFSHEGQLMASASYDGTVILWNLSDGQSLETYQNTSSGAYDDVKGNEPSFVDFGPNDQMLYFGGYNLEVNRLSIQTGNLLNLHREAEDAITCGRVSPDGRHLAFASGGKIYFIDLRSWKVDKQFHRSDRYEDLICEIAFVPDRSVIAAWTVNGSIHFWDYQEDQYLNSIRATEVEGSSQLVFSNDGRQFLTGNLGRQALIWDLAQERVVQTLEEHQAPVTTFAISQDGQLIATGSEDHLILLWKKGSAPELPVPLTLPHQLNDRKVELQNTITVENEEIELLFWDNQKIDGDVISVNLNGAWIIDEQMLKQDPITHTVRFDQSENYLIVQAHNVGKIPPNTVALTIRDGDQERTITLRSELQTSAGLRLIHRGSNGDSE